jgi:hypothetical protein
MVSEAPGANASAMIDRFCSALHRRRRSNLDEKILLTITKDNTGRDKLEMKNYNRSE